MRNKILTSIIATICITGTLTACGSGSSVPIPEPEVVEETVEPTEETPEVTEEPTEEVSDEDALTPEEQAMFDYLKTRYACFEKEWALDPRWADVPDDQTTAAVQIGDIFLCEGMTEEEILNEVENSELDLELYEEGAGSGGIYGRDYIIYRNGEEVGFVNNDNTGVFIHITTRDGVFRSAFVEMNMTWTDYYFDDSHEEKDSVLTCQGEVFYLGTFVRNNCPGDDVYQYPNPRDEFIPFSWDNMDNDSIKDMYESACGIED